MHLGQAHLRSVEAVAGLVRSGEPLVVSSDAGARKIDGSLFPLLANGCHNPSVFVGNCEDADVWRAAEAGLRPVAHVMSNATRYEEAMATSPTSCGPVVAGAARQSRLELVDADASDGERLGTQVIGPSMVAFLLWIRDQCDELGIRRIEFLARDGELPFQMAQEMPEDYWDRFDLGYLHCGRRSWSLAAAPLIGVRRWVDAGIADDSSFLLHSATSIPFSSLLDRCGLDIGDLPATTELSNLSRGAMLDREGADEWCRVLGTGDLDAAIEAAAQTPMQLVLDFLEQQELGTESIALVDVGWRGQQAWLMSALIKEVTGCEPMHLHFGGHRVVRELEDSYRVRRFAFDDEPPKNQFASPVACVEMFLASGKARLVGYERRDDGRVEEVFEDDHSAVHDRTREDLWRGARRIAANMASSSDLARWGLIHTPLDAEVREVLMSFWNDPDMAEVSALADLMFENDDTGDAIGRIIRPYEPREVFGRALIPRQWREASLLMTDRSFRPFMRLYFWTRRRLSI
jgi:hypothetical protein